MEVLILDYLPFMRMNYLNQYFILIEPLEGNVNLIKKNMAQSSIQCE